MNIIKNLTIKSAGAGARSSAMSSLGLNALDGITARISRAQHHGVHALHFELCGRDATTLLPPVVGKVVTKLATPENVMAKLK